MSLYPPVQGVCPACRTEALILAPGGHLLCRAQNCPRPQAANELLAGTAATGATNTVKEQP